MATDRFTLRRQTLQMASLILAGEAIFALPFHITRFFRPTVLEVFGLTATELGAAQGVYGVFAMLAYFPGGYLADRFPAYQLMAVSLWATACGGLYLATFPGYAGASAVWGFFGLTTILLFWGALIKATREWGNEQHPGRAYGLLESGRGLIAAALASVGVILLTLFFPLGGADASVAEKADALRTIIYGYTAVTAAVGAWIWYFLRNTDSPTTAAPTPAPAAPLGTAWERILMVLKLPAVWLQATVIICAYVGYKGFDNYSLYAVQILGMTEVEAAQIVTLGSWLRVLAALGAGLLGDRLGISRLLIACFCLLLLTDLYFAIGDPTLYPLLWALGNIALSCALIFGMRALYFALFDEQQVPMAVTGTAVGFVSLVGYTPDIFVAYVAGLCIDSNPGLVGHQHFFMFLAAFAALGCLASILLQQRIRSQAYTRPQAS